VVTKDYGSIESRILQTMSNAEVASVVLTDNSGKVISALKREIGKEPHLVFDLNLIQTPDLNQPSLQSRDEAYITTLGSRFTGCASGLGSTTDL
jgi:hypothetical protein